MTLQSFYPHRCGRNYWDVWDYPQTLVNQHFGLDINDYRPEVANDPNKFQVRLDCSHFKPEEIEVKTVDNNIVVRGKHEEKTDEHGWISREFTRKYTLPEECDPNHVSSLLNRGGVLTIEAPKKELLEIPKDNERVVPISVGHESSKCPHPACPSRQYIKGSNEIRFK